MTAEITGPAHVPAGHLEGTDHLRYAAQALAAAGLSMADRVLVGCTACDTDQVVAGYDIDGQGRVREVILWGIVRVLEHQQSSVTPHQLRLVWPR